MGRGRVLGDAVLPGPREESSREAEADSEAPAQTLSSCPAVPQVPPATRKGLRPFPRPLPAPSQPLRSGEPRRFPSCLRAPRPVHHTCVRGFPVAPRAAALWVTEGTVPNWDKRNSRRFVASTGNTAQKSAQSAGKAELDHRLVAALGMRRAPRTATSAR